MNRILSVLLFSLIHIGLIAQCEIQITNSNNCIGVTNNAFIHLLNSDSNNSGSITWSISPTSGVDAGVLNGTNNQQYYCTFTEAGVYTVIMSASDCVETTLEFEVFPLTPIETNVLEAYTLCNGNLSVNFDILNPENFNDYQWSNINVGNNNVEYSSEASFNVVFNDYENFTFIVSTTDLNQCVNVEEFDFAINEGPSLEEIQISTTNSATECVEPGTDYSINLSVSSDFQIDSYSPTNLNINTSETDINEEFQIPISIQYNSGCTLTDTFVYTHNINQQPLFTTDFDEVLCNGETITLLNSSLHLNESTEDYFSWSGIPSANIISESANEITFSYTEDGDYDWTLNYSEGNCNTQFSEQYTVDVDIIEPEYSFNNTNFCTSPAEVILTNTTNSGNNTYTYNWTLSNPNSSVNSNDESPEFSLSDIGTWDLNLSILSNSSCTFNYEEFDVLSLAGEPSFTTDFDGILCNGESITLVNTSPHLNDNTEDYFSWSLTGSENIISESAFEITFSDIEDGNYEWTLNYSYENCNTQFSKQYTVDVDIIEPEYSFNNTNFCTSPAEVILTNTTNSGNNSYTYNWTLSNPNTSVNSNDESPEFSLSDIGTWDLNLSILSNSNCTFNYEEFDVLSLVGEPSFTTDFDGVLCNSESITLVNTSPHLNATTEEYFSWLLSGSENIISESAYEITFSYIEDGNYNWTLDYSDGECNTEFTQSYNVDVDLIEPLLSSEINQMSCSFDSDLILEDITELDEAQSNYSYQWNIIPNIPSSDNSVLLTSSTYNPTFNIVSTEPQSYSVQFDISNLENSCSASHTFVDFYTIGGILIEATQQEITFCDQGSINTNTIIESQFVSQYNYLWTVNFEEEEINSFSGYSNDILLTETGNYAVNLVVTDTECSSVETSTTITVNESPNIGNVFSDIVFCTTPTDTTITAIVTNSSIGENTFLWTLENTQTEEITTTNTEVFQHNFITNGTYYLGIEIENDLSLCISQNGFSFYIEDINAEITSNLTDLCTNGQVTLSTTQSPFISSLEWNLYNNNIHVGESSNYSYSPLLESGIYDVELITVTNNGCVNTEITEEYILVNDFIVDIEPVSESICLNNETVVEQSFTSSITADIEPNYTVVDYSWNISSPNSTSASVNTSTQNNVSYNFTEPGTYTLEYTVWIDGDEDCEYTAITTFNVGLTATINMNDIICVGEEFEISAQTDSWSNSYNYLWSSSSDIFIENQTNSSTTISSNSIIPVGTISENSINLIVTNDVGCWTSEEANFDVYDIEADFTVADSILNCSSEQLVLNSINNDYINSWTWTIEQSSNNFTNTSNQSDYNTNLTETGYSSVNLSINSIHGCSTSLFKDSVVLVNAFEVAIVSDSIFCFNGASSIENTFISEISALYDYDYNIVDANWSISPITGVNSNTSSTNPDSISYSFTSPNTYNLQYSFGVESSTCTVSKNISFDVGVSAEIIQPSTICTGNNFTAISLVDNWSDSHEYNWTTNSNLVIETPNSSNTIISTTNSIEANTTDNYDLSLTVTNDVGCWDTYTSDIEIYEVIADFTISDSVLNCNPQNINLQSLNNNHINSWEWIFSSEQGSESYTATNQISTHSITNQGLTDITLIIDSDHGCEASYTIENAVLLNNYNVEINEVPSAICLNGEEVISQSFTSIITPIFEGVPYEIINYTWAVTSSNNNYSSIIFDELDSVQIEFSNAGQYELAYTIWIDGTDTDCIYSDTVSFNVGIDASIVTDEVICVGESFDTYSAIDLWSENIIYDWTSTDPIVIITPTLSATEISSITNLNTNESVYYNINLLVTNDLGCWETESANIEVYQVHADFTTSDSILHCSPQESTLSSLNNNFITEYLWMIAGEENDFTTSTYTAEYNHNFIEQGYSDISLQITSEHGCTDEITEENYVLLNDYSAVIDDAPTAICFNSENSITQSFNSNINPLYQDLPYFVSSYNWEIISTNNSTASLLSSTLNSVNYSFNEAGVYSLVYSAWIDGTNSDCFYSDTITFNVGLSSTINYQDIICVGEEFSASSTIDLWSESHSYLWSSTDELIIESPNTNTTNFSSITNLGANITEYYDLSLTVTNNVGCWESNSLQVEVYDLVADFELSDTLLHCSNQDVVLSSINNEHISTYNWTISQTNSSNSFSTTSPDFLFTFNEIGYSDISLQITSEHGCTDLISEENYVLLNDYSAVIDEAPSAICFNGENSITQAFNSSINALYPNLPYVIDSYNWDIISTNNSTASLLSSTVNSVNYSFNEAGVYSLVYSAWIDGTNSDCFYSDTIAFNIGVHSDILVDEIICVGGLFNASTIGDSWSESLSYQWSSDGSIIITDPLASSTNISTENNIGANTNEYYELNVTVINDAGCWEMQTVTIQAYEVIAEYTISDDLLFCSPQNISLESTNNEFIINWGWTISTNSEVQFESNSQNQNLSISDIGIYDINLQIGSIHGCIDEIELPAVVLNDLDPVIENIDGVNCFNGETEIIKSFDVQLNPSLANSPEIINFNWTISPNVVILSESVSEIEFLFTESDNYTLNYTVDVANENGTSCVYSNEIEFSIGVNSSISIPSVMCQGIPFEIKADVSIGIGTETTYNWSSTNDILFSNPTELSGTIESFGEITGDEMEQYTIDFIVSNDNGCWESQTQNINTYSAVADFTSTDEGEICAPVVLNFNSLYNDNISSYEWSYQGINYLGETLNYTYPEDSTLYGDYFNEMAIYDITLSVISVDGCTDTITKAELLDIKRPYPYFFIGNSIICDGEEINIVDSSYYTSNVGMYTQNVFYDSTFYQINDTTSITYTFPYELTEELQYNYSVKLNGFLGQCTAQYTDSMTVLPNAQIDVILSDSIGCPPFTVEFTENSTYLIPDSSIYFWDFGDGTIDSVQHPTHTYTEPGAYNVYHSVLTENGCFSDSILSTQIEIFEYPVADFNFFVTTFCSGLGDLQLNNTSIYITDTIACYWSFELDSLVETIEFNPLIHFEETNVYYASLQITDLHGCVDDTTKLIEITVLDTIVSQPILNYVSVNSTDVYIEWASVQDENFESLSLFHSLDGVNWNTIYSTNDLSLNNFTHDVDTETNSNIYGLIQYDSCGYTSNFSVLHPTILLNATSTNYQEVSLNWTPYTGWDALINYEVYRYNNGESPELLVTLDSTLLNYTDKNLCNKNYNYYIKATGESYSSNSNIVDIEPLFIDYTIPFSIDYTTIFQNESILTEWTEIDESFMSYYNIDRWDTYFGWIEDFAQIQAPPYIDYEVGIFHRNYLYRIHYKDDCGNMGPWSNIGTNILLTGEQFASHYVLDWTAYEDWNLGVQYYSLEYLNQDTQVFTEIETFDNSTFTYTDTDLNKPGLHTNYCYRIIGYSSEATIFSVSNNRCFIPAPKVYFPNAFSPNNDQLNDTYFLKEVFAKSLNISIYDQWGTKVFTSIDVDFQWEGTHMKNGVICPQGTYTLEYEIMGVNGSNYNGIVTIHLVR